MSKHGISSLLIWLALSYTILTILFYAVPVFSSTIRVPQDYPTIQDAIYAAHKGDVILVSAGIYYEDVVIIEEVELIGEDKTTTIIDHAQQIGDVIQVQVSAVTIAGFTIRNGDNGIRVAGSIGSINITDNIIANNRYGISFMGDEQTPTMDNIIAGNTFLNNSNVSVSMSVGVSNIISQNDISGSAYGIKLFDTNTTTISDNLLTDNSYGIYMIYSGNNSVIDNVLIDNSFGIYAYYSDNILIRDNQVSGSAYAIQLYDSYSCTILHNDVSDNPSFSIYLVYSNSTSVTNNTVSRNDWGLMLYDSSLNTFEGNTVSHNTFGITLSYSPNNIFYHNNIIDNVDQITLDFTSTNTWSQDGEGNYWSDYTGEDLDHDGIGDTFIPHLGLDYYPLMNQWGVVVHDAAVTDVTASPTQVLPGDPVTVNVTVANEGDFTETFNVTTYYDDTPIETQTVIGLAPSAETTLTFIWDTTGVAEGTYTIKAVADTVPGETDTADNIFIDGTVTISTTTPPVASFTFSPLNPYTGEIVTFNASTSYDPDGFIVSYFWDFGDGTNGTGEIATHSFADDGTYPVALNVTDNDGVTDTTSADVNVLNRLPVAIFTESAETVDVGETIYFNASDSYDPDGFIVSYFWDFGDDTNATGETVVHAYAEAGIYNVTLTVTDDDNATDTTIAAVTVSDVVRDVAVIDVVLSATEAYPTWIVPLNITVVVENQGESTETFNVTVYYNLTAIETQTVTLAQGANTTLVFSWNLSGVAESTYTIRAEASVLIGETDIADNSLIDGTIELKHPGDANEDGIVNVYDLNILAKALGTSVGDPDYDSRADFNGDGVIDDYDVEILQLYWGP